MIDSKKNEALHKLCSENGSTSFMGIVALVNLLFHKYTFQNDITLGSPVAGRDRVEFEDQLGFYVNTLALRTRFDADGSYLDLLGKVKKVIFDAFKHQQYPFDLLVDELALDRDMSRSPLFDVLINHEKVDSPIEDSEEIGGHKSDMSKFDLMLSFLESSSAMKVSIVYNTALFAETRMDAMARHFKKLVEVVLESPNKPIGQLNYLSQEEENTLLYEYNNTQTDFPMDKTIPQLFHETVLSNPMAKAVSFGEEVLTYAELDIRTNQVANYLKSNYSVQSGDLVGIITERSASMIVSILGIIKSGAGYVPIDSDYPLDRIEYMVSDTNLQVLICTEDFNLPGKSAIEQVKIESLLCAAKMASPQRPESVNTPDSTAYIMYTSGSTGRPKGVLMNHLNVSKLVRNTNYLDFDLNNKLLQTGSLSFDASIFELFGMLLNGGEIHLLSTDQLADSSLMKHTIRDNNINLMFITTSWLNQLVDEDIEVFSGLRTLITGGEKLSAQHINKLTEHYPSLQLINAYGPTENTTFSNFKVIDAIYEQDVPLGQPVSNSTVYLLDKQLNPVPVGVIGEIYVGGEGVAAGYLNRPSLTSEKFFIHPRLNKRIYRTGDMAYLLANGDLKFIGRQDDQVKIRGFRIEPGEVESIIARCEGVDQSFVTVNLDNDNQKYLTGYYVSESVDSTSLSNMLSQNLPSYMIPRFLISVDEFPLNSNGKIDRKKLPDPNETDLINQEVYEAPTTEMESQLVEIWQRILNKEQIGVCDNFFQIGGQSLKAMQIVTRLKTELNVTLSIKDIFNAPTVRQMAQLIDGVEVEDSLIIQLNQKSDKAKTAFLIPPVMGSSTIYAEFAAKLSGLLNCFGLQYKGGDKGEDFDPSIEDMASTFCEAISPLVDNNEVVIIGYSIGALVAFEMTKLLEQKNIKVNLVLLDRYPREPEGTPSTADFSDQELGDAFYDQMGAWLANVEPGKVENLKKLFVHNIRILSAYQIDGKVAANIMAIEALNGLVKAQMETWKEFTKGDFNHQYVEGTHFEVYIQACKAEMIDALNAFLNPVSQEIILI